MENTQTQTKSSPKAVYTLETQNGRLAILRHDRGREGFALATFPQRDAHAAAEIVSALNQLQQREAR